LYWAWYHAGVVGACCWHTSDDDRVAEQLVPADRFARDRSVLNTLIVARSRRLNSTVGQRLGNAGSIAKLFSSSYTLDLICYNVTTDFYAER
jgi:hypothetical protein